LFIRCDARQSILAGARMLQWTEILGGKELYPVTDASENEQATVAIFERT